MVKKNDFQRIYVSLKNSINEDKIYCYKYIYDMLYMWPLLIFTMAFMIMLGSENLLNSENE